MAVTSNLKAIADRLVQQNKIGIVLPSFTGTTTTLTLTTTGSSQLRGPFTGRAIPIGSPILITKGGTPGEDTYVSDWVPSTGVITVSPAITTGSTDAVLITEKDIKHGDWLMEAISRAGTDRLARWQLTPLTFVPDGDLRGATVTDYWTGTAATPAYVTPTFPEGSAAAVFSFGNVQRVLQSTTSNATNNVKSNSIDVALNSTVTSYQWYFQTAIRVVSGAGNAQFLVWDNTVDGPITAVNIIAGSDTWTHTTDSLGFINIEGTVNIPATCKQISFRLVSSATSTVIQMLPLVAYPVDAVTFPIPNRIESEKFIGNFHYATQTSGTSGPYSVAFSEPITTDGGTRHINNYGDHLNVTFNFRPWRPVYFDELVSDPELTSWTGTTTFPVDQVCKWARFELFDTLMWADPERPAPEKPKWRTKRNAALQVAQGSVFEPEMIQVVGRV